MKLKCQYASASEAGDEIFQVLFREREEQEDGPYVLVQRAWLEEDEGEFSPIYVETHNEDLIGHYPKVEAILTRNQFILKLPPPASETIEVDFNADDRNFQELRRMIGIILQKDLKKEEERNANNVLNRTVDPAGSTSG